jgi:tetratricopeptide (TPR) repeat protein
VPRSIQAILAARLDSLSPDEKRVTKAAAVVGRIFWDEVVTEVLGDSPTFDRVLRGLRTKELLVAREPSSLAGAREFGFRHILIRDVAYESMPKSERADQHLRVARWAEQRLAPRGDEVAEMIAAHYLSALNYQEEAASASAGDLVQLRRSVLDHACRAGRRAIELWQAGAAAAWFRVALEQANRLRSPPLGKAQIALEYLDIAVNGGPVDEALDIARETVDLLSASASDPTVAPVLAGIEANMARLIYATGHPDDARVLLERALSRFEGQPPSAAEARLRWALGWLTWRAYSPIQAVPVLERSLAASRAVGADSIERRAMHDLGIALNLSGRSTVGLSLLEGSMDLARRAGDQDLLLRCYVNVSGSLYVYTWDWDRALALTREGLQRARRGGHRGLASTLAQNLAVSEWDAGNASTAWELLNEAHDHAEAIGDEQSQRASLESKGELLVRLGSLTEGRSWFEQATRHGIEDPHSSTGNRVSAAWLRWPTDPRNAVSDLAEQLRDADSPEDMEYLRDLARMATRTGQIEEARVPFDESLLADSPRLQDEAAWRAALLTTPDADSVETITGIAEKYLSVDAVLVAAEAFSDAALLAARAGLGQASDLATRSRELYERCAAVPVLDGTLEGIGSGSAAPSSSRIASDDSLGNTSDDPRLELEVLPED